MNKIFTKLILPVLFYITVSLFIDFIIFHKTIIQIDWKFNIFTYLIIIIVMLVLYKIKKD